MSAKVEVRVHWFLGLLGSLVLWVVGYLGCWVRCDITTGLGFIVILGFIGSTVFNEPLVRLSFLTLRPGAASPAIPWG